MKDSGNNVFIYVIREKEGRMHGHKHVDTKDMVLRKEGAIHHREVPINSSISSSLSDAGLFFRKPDTSSAL